MATPEPDRCHSTTGPRPAAQTPNGRSAAPEASDGKHGAAQVNLLEQILSRENMLLAWKRVKANKGAAGVDGMSIDAFPEFARHHWDRIRSALERGTYRPAAVLRVMIPKATGGKRPLGINYYYGHSRSYTQLLELDQWMRRRVRLCYWKQWKRPRTRRRHLMALGISKDDVKLASRSRKGYWRMAGNSIVQRALTKQWLWDQGVPNMRQQWVDLHYPVPSGAG